MLLGMNEKKREDVIAAARQVFLLHGYNRVTMGDIAKAAGISRPGLYLIFPGKDDVFTAVMASVFSEILTEINSKLDDHATTEKKLTFVFDVWCVRPFETIQTYPEAKDLLESSYKFATEVTTKSAADFCDILTKLLEPLVVKKIQPNLTASQLAQIMFTATPGFKSSVKNANELRTLIAGLIRVVLDSLDS